VVDHGRVIAEGTPADLKADLGATVLEVSLHGHDDAGRTAGVLASIGPHAPVVNGNVVEVTVDNGPQAAMEALRSLDQQAITPAGFILREPSLDDVFLALTGRRAEDEGRAEEDRTSGDNRDNGDNGDNRQRSSSLDRAGRPHPIEAGEAR